MDMTRREFLGYSAGGLSVMGFRLPTSTPAAPVAWKLNKWRAFGISEECMIPESRRGYDAVIPEERRRFDPSDTGDAVRCCSLVILPSLLFLTPPFAELFTGCMNRGTTVIVESGAGFTSHRTFRRHRRELREGLQISVAAPVDLWSKGSTAPYVEYTWPRRAKVRDFSRVVPPGEQPGEIIAWAGDLPVALKRRVGAGTLIYLGSPLGPALWAGDVEARRWLFAVALAA